jgi:UDP-glucose 4-epimerase
MPKEFTGKVRYLQGDFSDSALLEKAITPGMIVIHLAGTSNQATAEKDPIADAEISIVGTLKLLEVAAKNGISKFIYLSSAPAVYGDARKIPVEVDTLPNPRSAYGAMKIAIEYYVKHYAEKYGFSSVVLRCANAYGPGQFTTTHGVVSKFAHRILIGEPIEIWGSVTTKRDFIFIEDLCAAIVKSIGSRRGNAVLNVASGKGTTLGSLIRAIEKASGIKAHVIVKEKRLIDVPDLYFSIKLTKKLLAWEPKVGFAEGVAKTVSWVRDEVVR